LPLASTAHGVWHSVGIKRRHAAGRSAAGGDLKHLRGICPRGHPDVAIPVYCYTKRVSDAVEKAQRRHATGGSTARRHLLQRVVAAINDVDVAAGVHGHAPGIVEATPSVVTQLEEVQPGDISFTALLPESPT